MKILLISYNVINRGTYLRAFEFARAMVKSGHQVTLITTSAKQTRKIKEWHREGIHIVEMPDKLHGALRSGWDPYNVIKRILWLKNKTFDIVHGFESRPTVIFPALSLKRRGVPLILDWCDWFGKGGSVEERPNPILRTLLRPVETHFENHYRTSADAATVICSTLFQRALELGIRRDNISIIPNGFDMPALPSPTYTTMQGRELFNLNHDDFIIGYIGSLFPSDAQLMSDAFKRLQTQIPNIHLLHLGTSNYGIDEENFPRDALTISGSINEEKLQAGISACDICWLPLSNTPANQGRFPLKFTNYIHAGKPVIVTDVGDIPKYVKENKAGIVCHATPTALAEAVFHIWSHPQQLKRYSEGAMNLSKDPNYSWEARNNHLLNLYRKVISNA